jgi:ribonuclease-3
VDRQRKVALRFFEKRLQVKFGDLALLDKSLTHSSFVNEKGNDTGHDNEALEFLGDAVLGMVVSHHLYTVFPSYPPGEYSTLKAALVNKSTLAQCARVISLGKYLKIGRGEELSHGRERDSLLADALEAVIGAIFVDRGLDDARNFILDLVRPSIEELGRRKERRDPKSLLQNITQERFKILPKYRVVSETGPDHRRKFEVELAIKGEVYGIGKGGSKKAAEQIAAKEALRKLQNDVDVTSASEPRCNGEEQ